MGIKKDHTFQPLYGADAWELNSKTMGDYSGVFPLATNNKKEEKWRKKILKKFEKLNEKRMVVDPTFQKRPLVITEEDLRDRQENIFRSMTISSDDSS